MKEEVTEASFEDELLQVLLTDRLGAVIKRQVHFGFNTLKSRSNYFNSMKPGKHVSFQIVVDSTLIENSLK